MNDLERKNALNAIYTSAGLQVVFGLIEDIVTETENSLIGEDPENEKAVVKLHYAAHAQRALFQRLTTTIDQMIGELNYQPEIKHEPGTMEERASENAAPLIELDEIPT